MSIKKVMGILLFPEFETLDVFGQVEVFGAILDKLEIIYIAQKPGVIKSSQGTEIVVNYQFNNLPQIDIFLVPGG